MNTIMIKCPKTRRWISTGIDIEPEGFVCIPEVVTTTRCPLCGAEHAWSKNEAFICEFSTTGSASRNPLFRL